MAQPKLKDISKKMKKLDYCMMTTLSDGGLPASRPMSNNGDVDYDGHSYFFTWDKSKLSKDLKKNPVVNLSFTGGKKDVFISVAGKAKLIKDRSTMEEHWTPDLGKWFEDGLDTPGIVMIDVSAKRIKMWEKGEETETIL